VRRLPFGSQVRVRLELAYSLLNDKQAANLTIMRKYLPVILFLLGSSTAWGQAVGRVDKRTKEFYIPSDQKVEYRLFGYEYPNNRGRKLICFSSFAGDVSANYNGCPLGAYFDTGRMKMGDRITYLAMAGNFARMLYIPAKGPKAIFYLPKSSLVFK
jgi:hypothetical protein